MNEETWLGGYLGMVERVLSNRVLYIENCKLCFAVASTAKPYISEPIPYPMRDLIDAGKVVLLRAGNRQYLAIPQGEPVAAVLPARNRCLL